MFTNSRGSLITPNEVKKYSPSDVEDDTTIKEEFIITQEEKIFNLFFGWDFYEALMDDRIFYEGLSTYKGDYNGSTAYLLGDSVQFVDKIYIALSNTTGNPPTNKVIWGLAPDFGSSDFDYLWKRYLRTILACNVLHSSVLYDVLKKSAQGLVKRKGETFDNANLKELQAWKSGLYNDIQDVCYNMDLFINRNPDKYPLYKPLQDKNCAKPKKRFPNYGINVGGSKYADKPDLDQLGDFPDHI